MSALAIVDPGALSRRIFEKLQPSGWAQVLQDFLLSKKMDDVIFALQGETQRGRRFTPPLKWVFRAFEECPWDSLRVVIVGHDPHPEEGVADGLAFSCGMTRKPDRSQSYIFQALSASGHGSADRFDPDLKRWANQGVLLLNAALTTRMGEMGAHYGLWSEFTSFVLSRISTQVFAGVLFVLIGKKAEAFLPVVDGSNHFIYKTAHPIAARYSTSNEWDCKNLFNEVNRILALMGQSPIKW